MSFLPVVNRELRVAARKRSTFWLRVAAAMTALAIGAGCMLLSVVRGGRASEMGIILFYVLTWLCLAAGLSAGLFFTSDCLSEEKREGTLGLLFLTDLRGYDVALGKLLATSLRGFFALLAVLPILAVTLIMGGVTGAQYWKSALALVNALFFSLAAGMVISAVSRDSQKALGGTLLVLLLFAVGGPWADMSVGALGRGGFKPQWSLSSPAYVLAAADAWGRSAYWAALATTHVLGWAMLALACALVPHTWQERKRTGTGAARGWRYAWRYGGARRRRSLRRKLIQPQPVAWLACRERWQSLGIWALALLLTAGMASALALNAPRETWMVWSWVGTLLYLLLYLWAGSQACRFFVEARRSGLLELMLATPLTEREIVAGHWRALRRMFVWPVLLLLSVQLIAATLAQLEFQRLATRTASVSSIVLTNQAGAVVRSSSTARYSVSVSGSTAYSGGTTNAQSPPGRTRLLTPGRELWVAVATAAAALISTAANLLALSWFGMWMGMTSRTANLATLKTIAFVQVIPWFVIALGSSLLMGLVMVRFFFRGGGAQPTAWLAWWPLVSASVSAVIVVAKDVGFIVWSRRKLHSSFREEATRGFDQPRFVARAPVPVAMAAPPVITAP